MIEFLQEKKKTLASQKGIASHKQIFKCTGHYTVFFCLFFFFPHFTVLVAFILKIFPHQRIPKGFKNPNVC